MHGYDMMWGGGGMWFGPLIMIIGVVLFVLLIVWLVRAMTSRESPTSVDRVGRPRQILDERYAKGEIDDAEYARRRSILEGDRNSR